MGKTERLAMVENEPIGNQAWRAYVKKSIDICPRYDLINTFAKIILCPRSQVQPGNEGLAAIAPFKLDRLAKV